MMRFLRSCRAAFSLVLLSTLLLGGAYPLLVTGAAQALFRHEAGGSLLERGDTLHGSGLIGQRFDSPRYFWGRLSALPEPYNPAYSGGSNLGVNNLALVARAEARADALQKADPRRDGRIPVDLVTASASGLDPHISEEAARYQLPRVARARGLREEDVMRLVERHRETPFFGLLGASYVNIVTLNLALDERGREAKKRP